MNLSLIQDEEEGHLVEYAVGKNGEIYPEGTGRLMKADAIVRFNMHLASVGEEVVDRARLGVKFYPKGYVPKHRLREGSFAVEHDMDTPAGEANARTDSYQLLTEPMKIVGFQPHMHYRGKRQCLEAIYSTGRAETLICSGWDFGWHTMYHIADEAMPLLPANTMLHVISWHDNSLANVWNPDPKNWIGYGHRTIDDMSFVRLAYFYLSDEEFEQEVRERMKLTSDNH